MLIFAFVGVVLELLCEILMVEQPERVERIDECSPARCFQAVMTDAFSGDDEVWYGLL